MFGPSGFFLPTDHGNAEYSGSELELLHTSEEGFNVLYRICKHGRFFVYKALKEEYRGNHLYEELLNKDFNIGFSLNHINICQYYAKISHPVIGNCIVMEWIDGVTLESMISQGISDASLSKKIICEICDALDYMHRKQIIHRDLKPENILITHNGQNVKIIDFGLSDADSYNIFKSPAGTRMYASPELVAGEQIDGRSDIWSLGIIINEINRRFRHVASRCTHRDKERRYSSAADVKKSILNEGLRRTRLAVTYIAIISVIIASALIQLSKPLVPETEAEIKADATEISDTASQAPAKENPGIQQIPQIKKPTQKPADEFKSEDLEDLLNSAAQSIL